MRSGKDIRPHRAFTLVELLAVMGIMMLMATVAVMSYIGATRGAATRSAVQHLQNSLSFARQTAIMNRRSAYVIFQQGSNYHSYVVCLHNGSGEGDGVILTPDKYGDWSGLTENGLVYNLDDGEGSIITNLLGSSIQTVDSIWDFGTKKYGWPIQKEITLPRHFVVAEAGEDTLPETVRFGSDGTLRYASSGRLRINGQRIDIYEALPGIKDPPRVQVEVELTGFSSVTWP